MRSRDIERILSEGRQARGARVVVFLAPGSGRCAVVASKRIGGAVERNRARRIMRVAWTHVSGKASGMDVVVVAKPTIRSAMAQDLVNEMAQLLAGTGGHP